MTSSSTSLIRNQYPARLGPDTCLVRSAAVGGLSIDQKVDLLAGADMWHTVGFVDPPVPAIRVSDGPAGARGTSWDGVRSASFPCGSAARRHVGPGPDPRRRAGARAGGPVEERARAARPDGQPPPHADRRAQLRVLQRGPGPHRRARRRLHRGAAGGRRRRLRQAPRRQRHRVRADDDLVGDRRAHVARAVPRPVRGGRAAGRHAGRDECVQPAQRHLLRRAPVAAHRGAARRVGVRRRRDQRLVRDAQRGRVVARRARPRDAGTAAGARAAPPRRARRRGDHRGRPRPLGRPAARPRPSGPAPPRAGRTRSPPTIPRPTPSSGGPRRGRWCC